MDDARCKHVLHVLTSVSLVSSMIAFSVTLLIAPWTNPSFFDMNPFINRGSLGSLLVVALIRVVLVLLMVYFIPIRWRNQFSIYNAVLFSMISFVDAVNDLLEVIFPSIAITLALFLLVPLLTMILYSFIVDTIDIMGIAGTVGFFLGFYLVLMSRFP